MSPRPGGKVRIVAGAKRGHRLTVPAVVGLRPTSEKVREAIFDVLGAVSDLSVLDLFAGTGAMGLEALSRGARGCVFVERDPVVATVLQGNIAALGYQLSCRVIVSDYLQALRRLAGSEAGFDLLFVDPPYRMLPEVEAALEPWLSSVLKDDGVAVIEGDRASQVAFGQAPVFDRAYGDTRVTMIRMRRSIR
ncbi:MAG: 16S rRNA (guanine(966)-N(2))-methyltransferase RsmD [bacterium]